MKLEIEFLEMIRSRFEVIESGTEQPYIKHMSNKSIDDISQYLEKHKEESIPIDPIYDYCPRCKGSFIFRKPHNQRCCWCRHYLGENKRGEH